MKAKQPLRLATLAWGAAAVAVFGVLLWVVLATDPWQQPEPQRELVAIGEVTYQLDAREWRGARSTALRALSAAEEEALAALEAELDELVAELFSLPRDQIALVADWYYSMPGQLIRATSRLGVDLHRRLIERMFPPEPWNEQQAELLTRLAASADSHMRESGEVLLASFHRQLRDRRADPEPNAAPQTVNLDVDQISFIQPIKDPALERQALALVSGALSALAARRAAQTLAARTAGRQAGASMSTACVGTGLAAWLCAAGVFSVTLLSTELALMHLDEARNREEFEALLAQELDRIEAEFAEAWRATYLSALSHRFKERQQMIETQLRPVDLLFAPAPEKATEQD